jgi:hypothetical protein
MNNKHVVAALYLLISAVNFAALMFLSYCSLNRETGSEIEYVQGTGVTADISRFFTR